MAGKKGTHPVAEQVHRGDPMGALNAGYGAGHTGNGANSGKAGAKRPKGGYRVKGD